MKKHLAKIFGGVFALALVLTGCATVSNINNPSTEMLYQGGSAVTVGNHTYFANAYTPYTDTANFDYAGNAQVSYLARLKTDVIKTEGKDFSPVGVEKVVADRVTGWQNQDMFVLGNYIYFTSANTHQNDKLEHNYSLVTLWRCRLNGDELGEIFTTQYFSGGKFAPVGDEQNGYYWVCFTGAYTSSSKYSGQIFSIKLGDRIQSPKAPIVDQVLSAAFANAKEDGSVDKIVYTRSEQRGQATVSTIAAVDYSGNNTVKFDENNKTINLIDKVRDTVFFTTTDNTSYSYFRDIVGIKEKDLFVENSKTFAYNTSFTDVKPVSEGDGDEGYVYIGSGSLMYRKTNGNANATALVASGDITDILFVDGIRVYYSTDTKIARIAVKPIGEEYTEQVLVTATKIQSGQYGFDGEYVYYYATLEDVETEQELEADDTMYAYRVSKTGEGDYQLISQTKQQRSPKKTDE